MGTVYFIDWSNELDSWIGVLNYSHGVDYWGGFLEWNLNGNKNSILVVTFVSV